MGKQWEDQQSDEVRTLSDILKWLKKLGTTLAAGVSTAIGDTVVGGTNDQILYVSNSTTLTGDTKATRDSTTNYTQIGATVGSGLEATLYINNNLFGLGPDGIAMQYTASGTSDSAEISASNLSAGPTASMSYTGAVVGGIISVDNDSAAMSYNDDAGNDVILALSDPEGIRVQGKDTGAVNYALSAYTGSSGSFDGALLFGVRNDGDIFLGTDTTLGNTVVINGTETTSTVGGTAYNARLIIHDQEAAHTETLGIHKHSATDTHSANISLGRTRGTEASETVVSADDQLGRIAFLGHDGTDLEVAALITGLVDGTPGAGDMPGRLEFSTTPDSSGTPVKRMRIDSAGLVTVFGDSSNPGRIALREDTDNGANGITITSPAAIASDKTQTLQDLTGSVALIGVGTTVVNDGNFNTTTTAGVAGYDFRISNGPNGHPIIDNIPGVGGYIKKISTGEYTSCGVANVSNVLYNGLVYSPNGTDELGVQVLSTGVRIVTAGTMGSPTAGFHFKPATGLEVVGKTIDTTAGDSVTISAPSGRFRKDTTGTTFTLTNTFITANSIILLTPANAAIDATATTWTVSAGAGSATITFNAAPTSNFDMNFLVIN